MLLANLKCVAYPIFCWPKTGLPSQKFLEPPLVVGEKMSRIPCFISTLFQRHNMADLREILFWKKALICDNVIVRILANSKCCIGLILSKYCIQSIRVNLNECGNIYVDDCAEHGRVTFY